MTTDYFTSIVKYSDKSILKLENIIDSVSGENTSIEIMCNPGKSEEYSYLKKMENLDNIVLRSKANFIDYSML